MNFEASQEFVTGGIRITVRETETQRQRSMMIDNVTLLYLEPQVAIVRTMKMLEGELQREVPLADS